MAFDFSFDNANLSAKSSKRFKPYTINLIDSIKAEVKTGANWKAIVFTFTGAEGSHSEYIFTADFNKPEDMERKGFPGSNGHETAAPSKWESFYHYCGHILDQFYPKGKEIWNKNVSKIKSADDFVNLFVKIINSAPKNEINLKLVGKNSNGSVFGALPKSCGLPSNEDCFSKDANGNYIVKPYPRNFLGADVYFTPYELEQQKKLNNAKPTEMPSDPTGIDSVSTDVDDLPFEL